MAFDDAGKAASLLGTKGRVERGWGVGVEIVNDEPDRLGMGIVVVDEVFHPSGKIDGGASFPDPDMTPTAMTVDRDGQATGATAGVFVVDPASPARHGWEWGTGLGPQRIRTLVKTDDGMTWVGWRGIQVEDCFHPPDERGSQFRDAPRLLLPWLEVVFFLGCDVPFHR